MVLGRVAALHVPVLGLNSIQLHEMEIVVIGVSVYILSLTADGCRSPKGFQRPFNLATRSFLNSRLRMCTAH
jgi:hypothetical protein